MNENFLLQKGTTKSLTRASIKGDGQHVTSKDPTKLQDRFHFARLWATSFVDLGIQVKEIHWNCKESKEISCIIELILHGMLAVGEEMRSESISNKLSKVKFGEQTQKNKLQQPF